MTDEDQALAAFQHAAEELRFFKAQQWSATNYASLAQVALAAAPHQLAALTWVARIAAVGLSVVVAVFAIRELLDLDEAICKERLRMKMARASLPLIRSIHEEAHRTQADATAKKLRAAIIIGAVISIVINVVDM